jgi:hypothetical protein
MVFRKVADFAQKKMWNKIAKLVIVDPAAGGGEWLDHKN